MEGQGATGATSLSLSEEAVQERMRWVRGAAGGAALLAGAALFCTVSVLVNEGGRTALELPAQEGEFEFPDTRRSEVAFLTLEATKRQILSQSPTDATRFWWHLCGS